MHNARSRSEEIRRILAPKSEKIGKKWKNQLSKINWNCIYFVLYRDRKECISLSLLQWYMYRGISGEKKPRILLEISLKLNRCRKKIGQVCSKYVMLDIAILFAIGVFCSVGKLIAEYYYWSKNSLRLPRKRQAKIIILPRAASCRADKGSYLDYLWEKSDLYNRSTLFDLFLKHVGFRCFGVFIATNKLAKSKDKTQIWEKITVNQSI